MTKEAKNNAPLKDIKVFDMSRILAGPSATQILGDLGADVIKVERPNVGDDTRKWGPPYLQDEKDRNTTESAYYLSANRNKRSMTLDFTKTEGQEIAKKLISQSDILIENYKTGTLERYGLSYEQLKEANPKLIYCSMTGFGQTGPYKDHAGYDFLIQGMGGIMSLTGPVDGEPYKTGVAVADLMTGMYALTGILAALHHRDQTGEGQFIDLALLDTQVAWLSNAAQYYLTSNQITPRMGNAHPTIVPYQAFKANDGYFILAIGNDKQFKDFCEFINRIDLYKDERFATNESRVKNRDLLIPILQEITITQTQEHWISGLETAHVPCGPINNLEQVFKSPQIQAREMEISMPHPLSPKDIKMIGSPLNFSKTPVTYNRAPPILGEHTAEILHEWGNLSDKEIQVLKDNNVV